MQREKPWYVQSLAALLVLLAAVRVTSYVIVLRPGDLPVTHVARIVAVSIAIGLAGWWLLRGNAWGYLLGLALAAYWLLSAAGAFLFSPRYASTLIVFVWVPIGLGCVVLAVLLMPRSVKWFQAAWHERTGHPAVE
jgi:hypothetical protein